MSIWNTPVTDTKNPELEAAEEHFLKLNAASDACVRVYLSIHVSELNKCSDEMQEVWKRGQVIYCDKIQ